MWAHVYDQHMCMCLCVLRLALNLNPAIAADAHVVQVVLHAIAAPSSPLTLEAMESAGLVAPTAALLPLPERIARIESMLATMHSKIDACAPPAICNEEPQLTESQQLKKAKRKIESLREEVKDHIFISCGIFALWIIAYRCR